MKLPSLEHLENTAALIYQHMPPSPQLHWPLLSQRCGCEVWVKHENHNPTGAFKVRGGLVYLENLQVREPEVSGVVTATRGNHGQSIAFAASRHGIASVVVVPEGNNPEKNLAMQALGAELIIHGRDFDEAVPYTEVLAKERRLHRMPSFHMDLVEGVASYALEFFRAQPNLERVYVPIGLGSGICGMICARNALGLNTEIIGVVSDQADCYARSLAGGHCIETPTANTLADGMAVRVPNADALTIIADNVARIVTVTDEQVLSAVSIYFSDTHNIAEGAGAAPLAALLKEEDLNRGEKVGVVLSGGNIDRALYLQALGS
ncbi:MAG: threonine dehydratase [Halioglobus sp.]|jgi:threonine dehydratase